MIVSSNFSSSSFDDYMIKLTNNQNQVKFSSLGEKILKKKTKTIKKEIWYREDFDFLNIWSFIEKIVRLYLFIYLNLKIFSHV